MPRYELLFGYVHCLGETAHGAGFAETEEEAQAWVRSMEEGRLPRPRVPDEEPVRCCEASFCPMKAQKPRFWFRALP